MIMSSRTVATFSILFTAICVSVAVWININVPEAYMDEIFHVPQTQKYCIGKWSEWDPKITTFPGLYLIATAAGRILSAVASTTTACSIQTLRSVNIFLAATAIPIFYNLAAIYDPKRTQTQLLLMTVVCCLFPLHFFYIFLYYTDVGATLLILGTWLAALKRRRFLAALLGAAAVLMRQTNAVWVAFIAAKIVLETCLPAQSSATTHRGGKGKKKTTRSTLHQEMSVLVRRMWTLRGSLMHQIWPLACIVLAFAAFVLWNGGVVVGDKAHHSPVQHLMQPLYCSLYCTLCLAPVFWSPVVIINALSRVWKTAKGAPGAAGVAAGAAMAVVAVAVAKGTLVHPFLLADNRLYPFYLWKRVIGRTTWARYALIPFYLYSIIEINNRLRGRGPLERMLLGATAIIVLVPAHLLELRYFTIVFYAVFLMSRTPTARQLAVTGVGFAVCNAVTLYVFAVRPFQWPDGSVARFMW